MHGSGAPPIPNGPPSAAHYGALWTLRTSLTPGVLAQARISLHLSFFEELSSATDRVSQRAAEVDGICSHGLPSAGRDVCWRKWLRAIHSCWRYRNRMSDAKSSSLLFSSCFIPSPLPQLFFLSFAGITGCRCRQHCMLNTSRKLLCADYSLLRAKFLGNSPSWTSS